MSRTIDEKRIKALLKEEQELFDKKIKKIENREDTKQVNDRLKEISLELHKLREKTINTIMEERSLTPEWTQRKFN